MNIHDTHKIPLRAIIIPFSCGIFLGIILLNLFISTDEQLKGYVEQQFKNIFYTNFNGIFVGKITAFSIFPFNIKFQNVQVFSKDYERWSWTAKKFMLGFSWLDALINRKINLSVTVQTVASNSQIHENVPCIIDHLKRFVFNQTPVPIGLQSLYIKNATCQLIDNSKHLHYSFFCNAHATMIHQLFNMNVYFDKSSILCNEESLVNQAKGKAYINVHIVDNPTINFVANAQAILPRMHNETINLMAQWNHNQGNAIIYTNDKKLSAALYNAHLHDKELQAFYCMNIPLFHLNQYSKIPFTVLDGQAHAYGKLTYNDTLNATGSFFIKPLILNQWDIGSVKGNFRYKNHTIYGCMRAYKKDFYNLSFYFLSNDTFKKAKFACFAPSTIPLSSWHIPSKNAFLCATLDNNALTGEFFTAINNNNDDRTISIKGTCQGDHKNTHIDATINNNSVNIQFPDQKITWPIINCFDQTHKQIVHMSNNGEYLSGFIDYSIIQHLLQSYGFGHNGTGIINFKSSITKDLIKTIIVIPEAHIGVPELYNHVQSAQASLSFDIKKHVLSIDNASLVCGKGTLLCKKARIWFDKMFGLSTIFFPITFDKVFINKGKNLFATVTGALNYTLNKNSTLSGFVIIDRSQLKQNIFSDNISSYCMNYNAGISQPFPLNFALNVQTKNPLHVKTSLLNTLASLQVTITGNLTNPLVSGTLDLTHGSLAFPYKPLTITSGKIIFLPGQLQDPLIDFTAKGKIRHYQVSLHAQGSAQSPHISLESTPTLSEEQIITLLLSGNEDGALALTVPSLAVHQLQQLVFNHQEESTFQSYVKNILGPLRNIRFIPRFTDQTARGGFRGIIEVDVSDKLRALIQKNFSLTEDTKLEVEYYPTDNTTIRAIRDERGDLGGEVEMRFKL